ncbi:MAG: NADH-quinone oxidoreductase subunit L, partial [Burkholderiaceae bacterium]
MMSVYLIAALSPLVGAILAGFFGKALGRVNSHRITILGVAISLVASLVVLQDVLDGNTFNGAVYTWA